MKKEPATILIRVPNPRDTDQFDHYLFWFGHRAGGNTYRVAALHKGSDPASECESWARDNFPWSAVDEGRHRWKKIRLPSKATAIRAAKTAREIYEPINERWRAEHDKALKMKHDTKQRWATTSRWRKKYDVAKDRLDRAEAMAHPVTQ